LYRGYGFVKKAGVANDSKFITYFLS